MGLSGTKTKIKIGSDPRNTAWSNDTSRFGHRHMKKMGWEPGFGLGIGSSGREATTTHVKVAVKVDNTGLGKKSSRKDGVSEMDSEITTGLDMFQRLLGRLNGKDEERIDAQLGQKRAVIANARFGMTFVHGGFLKPQEDITTTDLGSSDDGDVEIKEPFLPLLKKRKRKVSTSDDDLHSKSKKEKKEKKERSEKKEKKKKKERKGDLEKTERTMKEEKKEKSEKSEKSHKKEKKSKKEKSFKKESKLTKTTHTVGETSESMAEESSGARYVPRHLGVRARHIASKRAATQDAKSLDEIFMVKR